MLPAAWACRKDIHTPSSGATLAAATTGNLIVNGDFSEWDTHHGVLLDWQTEAAQRGVIVQQSGGGLSFSANDTGSFYVYQRVSVDKRKFYKATITTDYTINNYFSAGIYIMDSALRSIIGKFERTYSSGSGESWEVVFYSKKQTQVAFVCGFLSGINAHVTFTNAALVEYKYEPRISGSDFSAHLSQKFPLVFTARQYDSTILKISDYVNSVLLCRYAYFDDTTELPILHQMIGSDPHYAYFNSYRDSLDQIQVGYCQKSSLSLAEILTNEFNIPVRQVHMVFGPEGKHQFQEYWNPFDSKWIAIDPCFNIRYIKNNTLMGVEDFDRADAPTYMVPFGTHFYYTTTDDLIWFWQYMDQLMITDYYSITFPFSS